MQPKTKFSIHLSIEELYSVEPKIHSPTRMPKNPDPEAKGRFPRWLIRPPLKGEALFQTDEILKKYRLNTVCEEAKCPNRLECYSKRTATFLALGKVCTRACPFCDINFSKTPPPPEVDEPERIALSVQALGLKHVVITMVARDDLSDGGSAHMRKIIDAVRLKNPSATIEVLTFDFGGNLDAVKHVLEGRPDIFNYNIETVRRLTPRIRHKATYDRTLRILSFAKEQHLAPYTKSGLMVGLGETPQEVEETLRDLHACQIDIVTIGQYLQASKNTLSVKEFITPSQFKAYEDYGHQLGINKMYVGPFIRSSYNASEMI